MPRLFVYPKKGDSFWYTLKGEKVLIGRSEDNDLALPDPFSSGHHAVVSPVDAGYILRDNGSKNGTFLNGKKVQGETELKRGDEILVGSTRIIYDKELSSNVEVTEVFQSPRNVNTIIPLKDILKKQDIDTTIQSLATPADFLKIKSDYKSMAILNEVSKALVLHQPLQDLLEKIMDLISEYLPMDRGVLMLREGNPPQMIAKVPRIKNKNLLRQKILVSQSIINIVLDNHSSVLTADAQTDDRLKGKDSIIRSNIHSAMCVPLWNNREIIGVIYADRISLLEQFTEDDLRMMTLLSNLAAVKIENSRAVEKAIEIEKFQKELALAAQIQKDFLPKKNPVCDRLDISWMFVPCNQVGGDYYDFISIDPCRLAVIVADVSGKGISAALLMASLRAALIAEIGPQFRLENVAAKLNDFVHSSSAANRFISCFVCDLDMTTGQLRYVNAGHNPPIILSKDGKVRRLDPTGFCLGMFPSVSYDVAEVTVDKGEIVVLYTDGVTDARNSAGQDFGEDNLIGLLKKSAKKPTAEIVFKVNAELGRFSSGVDAFDDMTMIVLKRTG
jgi:sigma-B regulation protein RsbU (phosphoserine phosphatase)